METRKEAIAVVKTEVEDEVEQKMEQTEITGEKDELVIDEQPQAMEVDETGTTGTKDEIKNDTKEGLKNETKEEIKNETKEEIKIEILPKAPGLDVLTIGKPSEDDDDEETIQMTPDEVRDYLQEKICSFLKDPKINPILDLNKRSLELQDEVKEKNSEFVKLNKLFDMLYRNQERFLRQAGVLPKVPTSTIAVSVDLPILPSAIPAQNNRFPQDATKDNVLKKDWKDRKDLSITKVPMAPPPKPTSSPKAKEVTKSSVKADSANKQVPECIDLTDDTDPPPPTPTTNNVSKFANLQMIKHPAPLPPKPFAGNDKTLPGVPPKPRLKIDSEDRGIVLQWDMPPNTSPNPSYAKLASFDIFGYQEQKTIPINTLLWKKIGTVKAMNLPMACTLTQFVEGNRYHFSIRAVDIHNRMGSYSDPISVVYTPKKPPGKV